VSGHAETEIRVLHLYIRNHADGRLFVMQACQIFWKITRLTTRNFLFSDYAPGKILFQQFVEATSVTTTRAIKIMPIHRQALNPLECRPNQTRSPTPFPYSTFICRYRQPLNRVSPVGSESQSKSRQGTGRNRVYFV
jgi:hypothetical protein